MMVERSTHINEWLEGLNQATVKINRVTQERHMVSEQDISDLLQILKNFNSNFDPSFFNDKKMVPEEISASIEQALAAITVFQRNQPEKDTVTKNNINQAIAALFANLAQEINAFDTHIKNLKDHKIGHKIEKIYESKGS